MKTNLPTTLQELIDRIAITDLATRYSFGIDLRDWPLYRSIFTDQVSVLIAWTGVDEVMTADEWVARVAAMVGPFDASQHRMTNIGIHQSGDTATLCAQMTARHMLVIDGREHHQLMGGYYTYDARREDGEWRIARLTLTATWEEGDRGIFDLAAKRGPRSRRDVGDQGMTI